MKLDELPMPLQRALITHEALRRCGFDNDDIFCEICESDGWVAIELRTQGKTFNVGCGGAENGMTAKRLGEIWNELTEKIAAKQIPITELERHYHASDWILGRSVQFVMSIMAKGIRLPVNAPEASKAMLN